MMIRPLASILCWNSPINIIYHPMCLTLAFIGLSLPYLPTFHHISPKFCYFLHFLWKRRICGFFSQKKEAFNLFLTSSKLLFCTFLRILRFYMIEIDDSLMFTLSLLE